MPFPFAHWFVTGTIAIVASWALTGCRLGNNVAKDTGIVDTGEGYYEIFPESLTLVADQLVDNEAIPGTKKTVTVQKEADIRLIPETVAYTFTNPVYFYIENAAPSLAAFYNYALNKDSRQIVAVKEPGVFASDTADQHELWFAGCTFNIEDKIDGTYAAYPEEKMTALQILARGRIAMTLRSTWTLDGDCAASLNSMAACYDDITACPGSTDEDLAVAQARARFVFGVFVEGGTLQVSEIPNVTSMTTIVKYE